MGGYSHRAKRRDKAQTIQTLSEKTAAAILRLNDGDEACIAQLLDEWYRGQRYEFKHIDIHHGYVWAKDGGATFALKDNDQFDILNQVTNMLEGKRGLDFSKYDSMVVGLLYDLYFTGCKVNDAF